MEQPEETHMVGQCDVCGGITDEDLIATCIQCNKSTEHPYCMRIIPMEFPDYWVCESCEVISPKADEEGDIMASSADLVHHDAMHPAGPSRVLDDSGWQAHSRRQKPVETGKVEFIPNEEVIRLSSGEGSQFAEIDAFEKAYAGKNKQLTNETAKAKHDEMVAKKNDYLEELAKEYPEGTLLDEMSITDQDAGRNIVMDVLGKKLGRPKRKLGFGRVLGSKTSSSSSSASSMRLQQLEDQLVAERTAREANQNYLQKLVQQISSAIPGFVPPPADFIEHVDDEDHET